MSDLHLNDDDGRDIAALARALPPLQPPGHVWSRIRARIEEPARRRFIWRPQFAGIAAAAVLIVATAAVLFTIRRSGAPPSTPAFGARQIAASVEAELRVAEVHYQKAIDGLELITSAADSALDPATEDTLMKNLAVIDGAINESRAALAADPASAAAQYTLLEGLKAKVALLQDTVTLMNHSRANEM